MPTMSEISATTTIISISVTPAVAHALAFVGHALLRAAFTLV
jgi:hypothetical protein